MTRDEIVSLLPDWLTVAEAAALAGVSRFTVYERIGAGRMATRTERRAGRDVTVVRTADVLEYGDARRRRGGR